MAYTSIDDPTTSFNTALFTGTTNAQSITGVGFQPGMTWIKVRDANAFQVVQDSVRGATGTDSYVMVTQAGAIDVSDAITSFDSDGFSVGTDSNDRSNYDGQLHVAWNWKAGTSFSNDASSTGIGSIDSSGKVDDTSGFSIVSWTGTGANATVKHGLSTAPSWILVKNIGDDGENWVSFHSSLGATLNQKFNNTEANQDTTGSWNDTAPTTSVFTVGSFTNVNKSSGPMIAYCWAEKKGYSKFGQYTGNGSANGPYIFTGFKPALVIYKNSASSGGHWQIHDTKRSPDNVSEECLRANLNGTEVGGDESIDILSNGFKPRGTSNNNNNHSGDTYVYMAFAESPFVNSNGAPGTAR